MKLLAACACFGLLLGCESKRVHLREPAAPPARPNSRFAGIDTTQYHIDSASIRYGRYLVARETEEQFVAVFYRPAPDSSWQKVAGFQNLDEIDTANVDRQGREELLLRSRVKTYGSGGGTECSQLAIYQCTDEPRKVFEAPTLYSDEWFYHEGPNSGHYYSMEQDIRVGYGFIKVGNVRKSKELDCLNDVYCLECTPKLVPGRYVLTADTVRRATATH